MGAKDSDQHAHMKCKTDCNLASIGRRVFQTKKILKQFTQITNKISRWKILRFFDKIINLKLLNFD